MKYRRILRKVINEAIKQQYSRCRAKSNNKLKIKWNIMKKETGKVHSVEQVPTLLVNDKNLKDPTDVANTINN
jgi:hypothetical protein